MENQWTPQMMKRWHQRTSLPVIWDADFLYGPPDAAGADTYFFARSTRVRVSPFPTKRHGDRARAVELRLLHRLKRRWLQGRSARKDRAARPWG